MKSSCRIPEALFQSDAYVAKISNKTRELVDKRQQGGVLSEVRGSLIKNTKSGDADSSSLGRWNSLDVVTYYKTALHYCMKAWQMQADT